MRWNYEVKLGETVVVEGFVPTQAEANRLAMVWLVKTVLSSWPDIAPTVRVWR